MKTLLIVEDDLDLREGLEFAFHAEGYRVLSADTIQKAREHLRDAEHTIHGILLDCNLPDGNGFDLCREIRQDSDVPILMLTARDSELDEVKALELGVSDYMSKPFSIAVLKARVNKMLSSIEQAHAVLESGAIRMDLSVGKVEKDHEEIRLSVTEFKLLSYFLQNQGQLLSKDQILWHVWENDGYFMDDNIVSVNIRRLRRKIEEDPKHPERIKTVHGMGYIWEKAAK